jgi:hypothetical protein
VVGVDERTLAWFRLLAQVLLWGAALVLALSVIGAIAVASSQSELPFLADLERESRAIAAIAALGGGVTGAGILAGLGAILRILLDRPPAAAGHRERGEVDD